MSSAAARKRLQRARERAALSRFELFLDAERLGRAMVHVGYLNRLVEDDPERLRQAVHNFLKMIADAVDEAEADLSHVTSRDPDLR